MYNGFDFLARQRITIEKMFIYIFFFHKNDAERSCRTVIHKIDYIDDVLNAYSL